MTPPIHRVHWKHCWRVIPTRYPSEDLLDRVVDPKDAKAIQHIDALTNTRLRLERGEISFLPASEMKQDPGSHYVMASFCYSINNKSRFSDGSYGVYYAASSLAVAVDETRFHREKFMRATAEGPMMLPMRVLDAAIDGQLHDIRGMKKKYADVYKSDNYSHSQELGRLLWAQSSQGIAYDSVRSPKGECVAVFKPSLLKHCRQERTLLYEWNGRKIKKIYALHEFIEVEE